MPRLEDMTEEEQDALRDRYAMAALTGLCAKKWTGCPPSAKNLADKSYEIADAMPEARDAKGASE
ncbi:MAG: hypothetical protein NXI30_04360 [bacterium]|nr:hypothetical protein [bacterium]